MKKFILLLLFAACVFSLEQAAHAQVVVVANSSVKVAELSKGELRDVFSGASTTLGGVHIVPALLKDGPTHESFLSSYIGKADTAYRASWRSLVFSGQGSMPRTFDSETALVDYVAATPGAIGYVAKATSHDKVKTLAVK